MPGTARTPEVSAVAAPPEENDLVQIRGQNWVVSGVAAAPAGGTTVVHLQSVADGRYGDTLSVIWEVEPGRRVLPAGSLPDASAGAFDPPEHLSAFLDAVRWSAVASADVKTLQAPFRSGVAVEPYQLEPVARAVGAPRVNLLLADDVGLGKTVEAGLVAEELRLRGRAHRIMVICPAGLTLKWRDEMADKFGVEFTVVDSACCARLRRTHGSAANPFRVYPTTIVSLPWLRTPKAQRLIDEVLPPGGSTELPGRPGRRTFDLLILDEAHHVAPSAPKQVYAVDSQQTRLIRRLVPHFEHRLFLSATPHNGYQESYTALLELIDNQRFFRGVEPDRAALADTVVRRLKSTVTNEDGSPRFHARESKALPVEYPESEREVHALLTRYAELRRKRVRPERRGGRKAVDLVTLLLKKRLFSSPAAFAHTVAVHLDAVRGKARPGSGGARRDDPAPVETPLWLAEYEEYTADLDDEELSEAEDDAITRAATVTPEASGEEAELLERMARWGQAHQASPDAKAKQLISTLRATCLPGREWTNERVVVFTEYRDTQDWLLTLLQQEGLAQDGRVLTLHGGKNAEEREQIRLAFQEPAHSPEGKVRILLATDAASEGIDLQDHCRYLINYDIPFNPNKLEQRIGRIDRYGQRHRPQIMHFVGASWDKARTDVYEADLEFLARIARKVAQMEEDLGEVNAVLAEKVQLRMTGQIGDYDIEHARTKKLKGRPTGGKVDAEQNVTEQVRRLSAQLTQTTDELGLTPDRVARVVNTALTLARQQPLVPCLDENPRSEDDFREGLFAVPPLTGSWERATRGLPDRIRPEVLRPVTFDPKAAAGRPDIVLTHLNHPLVAMSTQLLRAAVWNADSVDLRRVTAVVSDDPALETTFVGAYARFVLVGTDGQRLHEEILHAGGWLGENGWQRRLRGVEAVGSILDRALTRGRPAKDRMIHRLRQSWPKTYEGLTQSIEARGKERKASLMDRLAERRADEEKRINVTLDRLERTLRTRLGETSPADGPASPAAGMTDTLFGLDDLKDPDERRQLTEDRKRWRARLDGLEDERKRELAAIAARYRDPQDHLFPVAVVFVIPAKEAY
ncbi:DISARM system SNF2-like helicase DrmD [Streptomyces aidingensis]|uniref:SNF2 family N-terminal domain-containing protein n=1 Tax=Streptomyces aidingensis TaxID=910347 RepID=A0A1I1UQE2_9ACTN|nr:DISARM system SNF2-like helicase DrmD [Streptomyces aidingensis]SFD72914.1 SNF2 family N-terminal domain-containing protein [Streptomyces aidingensis]